MTSIVSWWGKLRKKCSQTYFFRHHISPTSLQPNKILGNFHRSVNSWRIYGICKRYYRRRLFTLQVHFIYNFKNSFHSNEMKKRDTDNYSGAKSGESIAVSNVFDCVKRCYVDSNCQAYQIDAPNSQQLKCQLFSESVGPPLVTVAVELQRTIGLKPSRLSTLHLWFKAMSSEVMIESGIE